MSDLPAGYQFGDGRFKDDSHYAQVDRFCTMLERLLPPFETDRDFGDEDEVSVAQI